MSRLTRHRSRVTYVVNLDTLGSTLVMSRDTVGVFGIPALIAGQAGTRYW
jgi:hypothetical protein